MAYCPIKKCLIVEGNVGAGKSTFLSVVGKHINAQIVYEPHDKWQNVGDSGNLLENFYKDTPRWAYTFQSYAFITRILEQKIMAEKSHSPVQVLERSVHTDRYCFAKNCYEMGTMSALEWELYRGWFEWLAEGYSVKPDGFIYLQTNPKTCYKRLVKRNRSEESLVPISYLEKLHDKHEQWLVEKNNVADSIKNVPVLILQCDKEFENNELEQKEHVEKIMDFFNLAELL
ncbi:deoxynucleoside kinase [bacterium]|jgi:deoxyadenosine/deoxycytidine kinase|nr:deoxynucleoside kinase [bacterium]